jgi:hypothetical protein
VTLSADEKLTADIHGLMLNDDSVGKFNGSPDGVDAVAVALVCGKGEPLWRKRNRRCSAKVVTPASKQHFRFRSSVSIPWFWSGSDMRARSAGGWPQRASNGVEAGTSKTECYAGIWSNPVRERRDVSVQYLGDAIIVTTKRVLWRQRF